MAPLSEDVASCRRKWKRVGGEWVARLTFWLCILSALLRYNLHAAKCATFKSTRVGLGERRCQCDHRRGQGMEHPVTPKRLWARPSRSPSSTDAVSLRSELSPGAVPPWPLWCVLFCAGFCGRATCRSPVCTGGPFPSLLSGVHAGDVPRWLTDTWLVSSFGLL